MSTNYEIGKPVIPQFHVGHRLTLARETAGITQQQLAHELGTTRRTLSRWESGKSVKRSTLLLYAVRTGVPVEWLERGEYTPRDLNPEPTDYGMVPVRVLRLAA